MIKWQPLLETRKYTTAQNIRATTRTRKNTMENSKPQTKDKHTTTKINMETQGQQDNKTKHKQQTQKRTYTHVYKHNIEQHT